MSRRRTREQAAQERRRVAKRRKRREVARAHATFDVNVYQADLDQADFLLDRERWDEAFGVLQRLDARFPNRRGVLSRLTYCCSALGRSAEGLEACTRLLDLDENDEFGLYGQAVWGVNRMFPALAATAAERFLRLHPNSQDAPQVREVRATLAGILPEVLKKFPFEVPDRLQLAAAHERMQVTLTDHARTEALARPWLERVPEFTPMWNNLAISRLMALRPEEARDAAERTLAVDPNNAHGLSKLARALALLGEQERAVECLRRLREPGDAADERRFLELEAWTYLGAWEEADEAYRRWDQADHAQDLPLIQAQAHHLGAATAARLGDEARAKHLWKRALALEPLHGLSRQNLADLARPAAERNGPFAQDSGDWISQKVLLGYLANEPFEGASETEIQDRWRGLLNRYPVLSRLTEIWLERGSPRCRKLALEMIRQAPTPAGLEALRKFAGSRLGSEQDRLEAMTIVNQRETGEASTSTRMFAGGEWRDLRSYGWEIYYESEHLLPDDCQELGQEALQALRDGDAELAERLNRQLLDRLPKESSIQLNLAQSLRVLGREEEAEAILAQLRREHPDYFFGHLVEAERLLVDPRAEQELAAELDWLMAQPRLHISEFAGLVGLMVRKAIRDHEPRAAEEWIEQLRQLDPDNPLVAPLERMLLVDGMKGRLVRGFGKLLGWPKKPRRGGQR